MQRLRRKIKSPWFCFFFLEKNFWVLYLAGLPGLPRCFLSYAQTFLYLFLLPHPPFPLFCFPWLDPTLLEVLPEVLGGVSTSRLELQGREKGYRVLSRRNAASDIRSKAWISFPVYLLLNQVVDYYNSIVPVLKHGSLYPFLYHRIHDYHVESHHFIDGEIEAWNGEVLSSLIP